MSAGPPTEPHDSTILRAIQAPAAPVVRAWPLFVSSVCFTGVGAVLLTAAGLPEVGTLTLFLGAAALHGTLRDLLEDNRAAIWERGEGAFAANRRTALGLVAIFTGMLVVFVALAAWYEAGPTPGRFGMARPAGDILHRRFGDSVGALIRHNLLTMLLLMVLGFVYRAYGALLALGWNAVTWAGVLTVLVMRALPEAEAHPALFVAVSALAVLPHLLVEAAAYVVGTLAAIFASRAVTRYARSDPRLWRVLRAVAVQAAMGVLLLVLAAVLERHVPPAVLALLGGG